MKTLTTLLAGAAALGLTAGAHAQTAYMLGNNGTTLVAADPNGSNTDGATTTSITADGVAVALTALTFRPQTGQLYGYDAVSGTLYTVNPATGEASVDFVFDTADAPRGDVQFDTNPNVDAFRFVGADGNNVVYFPDNSATTANQGVVLTPTGNPDTISRITYGAGYDAITTAVGTPVLVANGYTNQLDNAAALLENDGDPLLQYVLDATTDTIAILNNNAGTVDFEAFVQDADGEAIDFDLTAAFDVFSDGSTDIGFALLTIDGEQTLFSVDLVSYVFTALFTIDATFGALTSLAVFDADAGAVPIPAAGALFAFGAAGLYGARRRKRA